MLVAKMATKPSPVLLHMYSPGGCTINIPMLNCHQWGHIVLLHDTLFWVWYSILVGKQFTEH